MDSILEKLYKGEAIISEKNLDSEEYRSMLAEYTRLYQDFKTALTTELHSKFDELMECHSKLEATIGKDFFRQGFNLGIRLLTETLYLK